MEAAFIDYRNILLKDNYFTNYEELYNRLEDSHAYYQGEVIPFLYQPFFFSKQEIKVLEELVADLNQIINKIINKYLQDKDFRNYFNFPRRLEELILVDPGYNCNLPMARFDIFYYGPAKIKFCELNTDGSSGMVKTNILEKHFLETEVVKKLSNEYKIDYLELTESWIDKLLTNYQEFNPKNKEPNIAIMDFRGYGMRGEFEEFKEVIKKRGLKVKIVDPREVKYKGNKLYKDDFPIDLIYRRAVTKDLMDHYEEIDDFLAAYKNQDVCVVGSFRSQIIHNKVIFSILHDEEKVSFLNREEIEFINETIPYTADFNPGNDKQVSKVKNNKDQLVLKPKDDYGSSGVIIGRDVSQKEWEEKVSSISGLNYLVQEFLMLPSRELATFNDQNQVEFEAYKYILGLFSYNQRLKGIYNRAGKKNVIASATGCVTLPNFVVERK